MDAGDPYHAPTDIERLRASAGSQYLNRAHVRSVSMNILEMNALELQEAVERAQDAERSLHLFLDENEEASRQAHREVSRHLHNFLSAAKTMVDHTRVLINENYGDTQLQSAYQRLVSDGPAKEPVVVFAHDLRNYMLHKGVPATSMYIQFDNGRPGTGSRVETGLYLDLKPILAWSKLTSGARKFVAEQGDKLDPRRFVTDYMRHIRAVQDWLDRELLELHRNDLANTSALQAEIEGRFPVAVADAVAAQEIRSIHQFSWAQEHADNIDAAAEMLLAKVCLLRLGNPQQNEFRTLRAATATITEGELAAAPVYYEPDTNGDPVVAFIATEAGYHGLSSEDLADFGRLTDLVRQTAWAADTLGREFIEGAFFSWSRSRFAKSHHKRFAEDLATAATKAVKTYRVTAPVANLEVQSAFRLGPITIEPITSEVIRGLRAIGGEVSAEQEAGVDLMFQQLATKHVGDAAVIVEVTAEPGLTRETALLVAQDCVALIRVFSPGSMNAHALCPIALSGAEVLPSSKLIVTCATSLTITESMISKNIAQWYLSDAGLLTIMGQGLAAAGALIFPADLTPFALDVRASLMSFSHGLTLPDPISRLAQSYSGLEAVLLRHEFEPREASVTRRVCLMLRQSQGEAGIVSSSLKQGYSLLRQPRTGPLTFQQKELLQVLASVVRPVLLIGLENVGTFRTRSDFLDAVDALAFSEPSSQD